MNRLVFYSTSSHPIFEPWTHEVCMSIVELCISIENQMAYNYNVHNMYQTRVFYILILPRRHARLMSCCIFPSNKVVYYFLLPIHTLHIIWLFYTFHLPNSFFLSSQPPDLLLSSHTSCSLSLQNLNTWASWWWGILE